jgi:hypothetical protein
VATIKKHISERQSVPIDQQRISLRVKWRVLVKGIVRLIRKVVRSEVSKVEWGMSDCNLEVRK